MYGQEWGWNQSPSCCCSPAASQSSVCHIFMALVSSWSEPGADNSKVWFKPCMDHPLKLLVGSFPAQNILWFLGLFWDTFPCAGFTSSASPPLNAVPSPQALRPTKIQQEFSSFPALEQLECLGDDGSSSSEELTQPRGQKSLVTKSHRAINPSRDCQPRLLDISRWLFPNWLQDPGVREFLQKWNITNPKSPEAICTQHLWRSRLSKGVGQEKRWNITF